MQRDSRLRMGRGASFVKKPIQTHKETDDSVQICFSMSCGSSGIPGRDSVITRTGAEQRAGAKRADDIEGRIVSFFFFCGKYPSVYNTLGLRRLNLLYAILPCRIRTASERPRSADR